MLATYYKAITVLSVCDTTDESVKKILADKPQLVFLDVRLENTKSGFEILELTRKIPYDVIFTTGHDEYAVEAFKFSAVDYILKPFGLPELQAAMDKYLAKRLALPPKAGKLYYIITGRQIKLCIKQAYQQIMALILYLYLKLFIAAHQVITQNFI